MEVLNIDMPYKRSNANFHLYDLSDIHFGTVHCAENKLRNKVREIAEDDMAMVILGGDLAEFITPSDPRWDSQGITDWVVKHDLGASQENHVIEQLTPIKHKIIGAIYGNHEVSIHRHSHQDVHQHICDGLGVPNLGYSCFVKFHFHRANSNERHLITGAFTHGTGNAITEGAKINNLMRFMKSFEADLYGYSHVHDYIPKSLTRLNVDNNGKITNRVSIGATTGCWFRTYSQGINASYGEQKCFPPSELCCAMFTMNPNTGFIDVSRSV